MSLDANLLYRNITSLFVLQTINFFSGLVVVPLLTLRLGVLQFGELVFLQLLSNYCCWLVNWGFYLGATQRIASKQQDKVYVSSEISRVWIAQVFISMVGCFVLLCLFKSLFTERFDAVDILATLMLVLGNLLFPIWILNAFEKLTLSVSLQILVKVLAGVVVFFCIQTPDKGWLYLLALGSGNGLVGVFSIIILVREGKFKYQSSTWRAVMSVLRQDVRPALSSSIATTTFAIFPAVLGFSNQAEGLALYNLADRARGALTLIISPITHSLFPFMCKAFAVDKHQATEFTWKFGVGIFVLSSLFSGLLYYFADEVLHFLAGNQPIKNTRVLEILSVTPLLSALTAFCIHQILIPNERYRDHLFLTVIGLLVAVFVGVPLTMSFSEEGAAFAVLFCEVIVLLCSLLFVKKAFVNTFSKESE